MRLEIEIPDELLISVAEHAARVEFADPAYGNRAGNKGYILIAETVRAHLSSVDWRPLVQEVVRRLSPGVVEQVVEAELRRLVKEQVARGRKEGTLL